MLQEKPAKDGIVIFGLNSFYAENGVNELFSEAVFDAVKHGHHLIFFNNNEVSDLDHWVRDIERFLSIRNHEDFTVYMRPLNSEESEVELKKRMLKVATFYALKAGKKIIGVFDAENEVVEAYKSLGVQTAFLLNYEVNEAPKLKKVDTFAKELAEFTVNTQEQVAFDNTNPPRLGVDVPLSNAHLYPQYFKKIPAGWEYLDIYAVHHLFEVDDPSGALQHADKKLLLPGVRTGGKSRYKDIKEARDTLNRWLELNTDWAV